MVYSQNLSKKDKGLIRVLTVSRGQLIYLYTIDLVYRYKQIKINSYENLQK